MLGTMNTVTKIMYRDNDSLSMMLRDIEKEIPGFNIESKADSKLMWVLDKLMFWNKRFMRVTTTIGNTIHLPDSLLKSLLQGSMRIRKKAFLFRLLLHEYVHMSDRKRMGSFKYRLKYLSPQIYSLGALLALLTPFSSWFLLALGFLVFAAPWPSQGRTEIEANGYEMSAAVEYWMTGRVSAKYIRHIHGAFTSFSYYRMCPNFWEDVAGRLSFGSATVTGRNYFLGDSRLRKAYKTLLTEGMVHESVEKEYHLEAIKYYEQTKD